MLDPAQELSIRPSHARCWMANPPGGLTDAALIPASSWPPPPPPLEWLQRSGSHLLVEDRLGLTTVPGLLPVVTPLTYSSSENEREQLSEMLRERPSKPSPAMWSMQNVSPLSPHETLGLSEGNARCISRRNHVWMGRRGRQ